MPRNSFFCRRMIALVLFSGGSWLMPARAQLPGSFLVTVNKGGGVLVELNLTKHSVRSADFRVQSWDTAGGYALEHSAASPLLPVRTYRGFVTQNPNELVTAIVKPGDLLDAEVHNGSGRLWTVSNVDVSGQTGGLLSNLGASEAGGDASSALVGGSTDCGVEGCAHTGDEASSLFLNAVAPPGAFMPPVDMYSAHGVYDVPSSQYRGTVDATLAWLEYQWNIHDFFNARDAKLNILLTEVIVRKQQFYFPTTGNAGQFVGMLRSEWQAQGQNARGFIGSAFPTGFSFAGGFAVGNNFYAPGGEAVCVNALYHENGHNWGAQHWYYGQDTMSGSHPAHGAMNVARVLKNRDREITEGGPVLTTGYGTNLHPYGYPDLASTPVNTPIAIDVLANDWDANGDAMSIRYFSASTVQGGTVTQAGSVLTYSPPTGYAGKDLIVYEVQDTAGLFSQEVVHIEVVNQGLAAHWTLDESSGQTATDGSGHGHAGTLSGATFNTGSIPGPIGNALSLGGGQYMICDATDLIAEPETAYPIEARASNFFDPMDESFTVACWFKLDDASQTTTLFSKRNPGFFGYIVTAGSGGLSTTVRPWDGNSSWYTVTGGQIFSAAWYHMAMVINRSDHSVRVYLNGAEVGTAATLPSNAFIFNGREDLWLGGDGAVDFDDVRIYTKALTGAEIQALNNAGSVPAGGPRPGDGAVNQSLSNTTLAWEPGNPAYLHDVYFGTDAAAVAAATPASPEYQGRQAGASYDPGQLLPSSIFYWRIDEVDGAITIPGPVWRFGTAYSELLSDLVLHLTMDDDDVQTAEGVTHSYDDVAAPAQDFMAINAAPGQPGQIGEAVGLTTTSDSLRSYVENPVTRPLTGGVTISFWINTTSTQSGAEKVYDVGGAYFMLYYNGDLRPVFDGGSAGSIIFNTNINDGQWHHVVVRNNGAGITTLYVDGSVAGTQSEGLFDVGSLGRTMALGSTYSSPGENLIASYDDFALWQRALDATEIMGVYNSGVAGLTFNDEPVLIRSSFEAAEGFTGVPSGSTGGLGTVVDSDGVTWTELVNARIWNRADIPPDGVQTLTLGLNASNPSFSVQIPGATHGVGLVSFDYSSFSSSTDVDFSFAYNDNVGSGWVEVWSTHVSGNNPDWTVKPWATVEVPVQIGGDVDLRWASAGNNGVLIDNVRVTGGPILTNFPPAFDTDPVVKLDGLEGLPYVGSIAGDADDPDPGDMLTFTRTGGPGWLSVAGDGGLSGTPTPGDVGLNTFTVRVTDSTGLFDEADLSITVHAPTGTLFTEDFERPPGTTLGNGWIEQANDSRIYDANNTATHLAISVSAGVPFAIVKPSTATFLTGTRYELEWQASRATAASGTLIYNVAIGTWDGATFTPLASRAGSIANLNHFSKVAGPVVEYTASAAVAGEHIAVRFEVVAGSSEWVGFDDIAVHSLGALITPVVSIARSGSAGIAVVISWTGESGQTYGVETSANPVLGDWNSVTSNIPGTGGTITLTNAVQPDRIFYRVFTE